MTRVLSVFFLLFISIPTAHAVDEKLRALERALGDCIEEGIDNLNVDTAMELAKTLQRRGDEKKARSLAFRANWVYRNSLLEDVDPNNPTRPRRRITRFNTPEGQATTLRSFSVGRYEPVGMLDEPLDNPRRMLVMPDGRLLIFQEHGIARYFKPDLASDGPFLQIEGGTDGWLWENIIVASDGTIIAGGWTIKHFYNPKLRKKSPSYNPLSGSSMSIGSTKVFSMPHGKVVFTYSFRMGEEELRKSEIRDFPDIPGRTIDNVLIPLNDDLLLLVSKTSEEPLASVKKLNVEILNHRLEPLKSMKDLEEIVNSRAGLQLSSGNLLLSYNHHIETRDQNLQVLKTFRKEENIRQTLEFPDGRLLVLLSNNSIETLDSETLTPVAPAFGLREGKRVETGPFDYIDEIVQLPNGDLIIRENRIIRRWAWQP